MRRPVRLVLFLAFVAMSAAMALAAERFPPPDFTDHEVPITVVLPPSPEWVQYLDLGALVAALAELMALAGHVGHDQGAAVQHAQKLL